MNQPDSNAHSTVLDSEDQQVGALYGKAILGAAGAEVDEIVSQLNSIVIQCLTPHPGFENALASPRISQADKESLIDRVFQGKIHATLLNFLKVLCRRGRIGWLRAIQVCANEMRDQQLGRVRAVVTTAFELTDSQRSLIRSQLGKMLGKEVILDQHVDQKLLGGVMIRVGDQVYDGSIVGKMSAMRSAVNSGIQKAIREKVASLMSS